MDTTSEIHAERLTYISASPYKEALRNESGSETTANEVGNTTMLYANAM